MSRSTISTFKLFELFPDEPSARKYLEGRLWPNGVTYPECKSKERITTRKDGFLRSYGRRTSHQVLELAIINKWEYKRDGYSN
jgi:hypothetical protein